MLLRLDDTGRFVRVPGGSKATLGDKDGGKDKKDYDLTQMVEELQGVGEMLDAPVIELSPRSIREVLPDITGELTPAISTIIKPMMEGKLIFLREIKVGDFVKEGERIAKIDDRDLEDDIRQQEQQNDIAVKRIELETISLEQKKKKLEFDRSLAKKKYISTTELEASELESQTAEVIVHSHRAMMVTGVVKKVSDIPDGQTHGYKIWIGLDEVDKSFASGMFVRADIELARRENTIVVERAYVKEAGGRPYVQLATDGLVRNATVKLGLIHGLEVEIVSGVQFGDSLIASKQTFLPDQAVNPVPVPLGETSAVAENRSP